MKLTLALAVATASLAAQQGDPVVHMSKEPRHKVVFEAGTTRVQDVQIPAGDTSLYHIHDHALLYVPISSSRVRTQVLGADWGGGAARDNTRGAGASTLPAATPTSPGRVTSTTTYVDKPVTHRVGNIGDRLYRVIAIGNLSKGSELATDDVSGLGSPELENRYYRAFRVSLAPGSSTSVHKHAWPVVVAQQTAGQLAIEGSARTIITEPGKFAFHDGSSTHQVTNTGTSATAFVEVELRGGSPR